MTTNALEFLPFARPSITDRERTAVLEVLDSGWLTIGPRTKAFEAAFAVSGGPLAGTIGRAGAYSFYATKTITTGEGGMLVTADEALANRARSMSLHGISRDAWKRYAAGGSWYYEIEDAGFKDNMTDIAAALGLVQLSRADELLDARRALVAAYRTAFAASGIGDLVDLPEDAVDGSHAWHLFVIRLRTERLRIDRAAAIDGIRAAGIGTSVHFIPLHRHPYHRRVGGWEASQFPVAEREYPRVISLPLWPGMTGGNINRVVEALVNVLEPARA